MSDTNKPATTTTNIYDFSVGEAQLSPEMFSQDDVEASNSTEVAPNEAESAEEPEWKGVSMDEIHKSLGKFGYEQVAPLNASSHHTVLFALPLSKPPKPFPNHQKDKWSPGYVRMPHSTHSLYPNNHTNSSNGFRPRWEVIQEALLQSFMSTQQLETAILSYNQKYAQRWDFSALHNYFVDDEDELAMFCEGLLPKIVELALQLPSLVTAPIQLLKRHTNVALSLSQLQVGSLLANAFLCTFPRRNSTNPQSEYAMYPEINFNRLFGAFEGGERQDRSSAVIEKLKCIFHYFTRITRKAPEGVITIQRRYIPKDNCPRWNRQSARLPPLHITSIGTIETEGAGLLQVDFANKYVGGGVLGWGCVQEEIRFVICPELMVSMLVAEALDDTEALIVTGVEQYSAYEGYSDSFKWMGNFVDKTPFDSSGRRRTSVVAIDALLFKQSHTQFTTTNLIRELNKAYVGFCCPEVPKDNLSAIATGNWGCGAFRGNPQLKVLLQLMAAAVAGRSMVYFTFGDTDLRDKVAAMYWHLVERNIDVGQLFVLLSENQTCASNSEHSYLDFYHSLHKRSKMKPLTSYFGKYSKSTTGDNKAAIKVSEIKICGSSENTEKNINRSTHFTSNAREKEEAELRNIAQWLEEDIETDADSPQENKEDRLPTSNVDIKDCRSIETVKTQDETNDESENCVYNSQSESALPLVPKISKDRRDSISHQDINGKDGVERVAKKPRLSGLELLDKTKSDPPMQKQTLEELTILVNNINDINDGVKVMKKKQKKISDFFT